MSILVPGYWMSAVLLQNVWRGYGGGMLTVYVERWIFICFCYYEVKEFGFIVFVKF